jgi:glycosyltransferase involved in cell wall biosynthesis
LNTAFDQGPAEESSAKVHGDGPPSSDRAMHVLFVISRLDSTGGAGRSLAGLARGLRSRGAQVQVVCFRRTTGGLEEELEDAGVSVRELGVSHMTGAVRSLRRLLRRERPDLVHTTLYAADQAGRLAAWRTGIPVVSSVVNPVHDAALLNDPTCAPWRRRMLWAIDGWTARHLAEHLHAVTKAVKDSAVEGFRVSSDRVTVVFRSRDPARLGERSLARRIEARRRFGLGDDEVILSIGRQVPQKGHEYLVEAFERVTAARPRTRLLIAGAPGASTAAVEARIARSGVGERIQLLGHREDVGDLLVAADVLAFPSLYEGLGGTLIEAMALGLPIVASDLPALREVSADGEAAWLVRPADVRALSSAMLKLLEQPAQAAALAERARARFLANFTPEQESAAMLEFYRKVLAARGGAGSRRES